MQIRVLTGRTLQDRMPELTEFALRGETVHPSRHPAWLAILRDGLGHVPMMLEATRPGGETCGMLPLSFIRSTLFGRYLVSLPYLNSGGVVAEDAIVADELIDSAVDLAREMDVKHLELRHEAPVEHAMFNGNRANKVHMRLQLPDFPGPLWTGLNAKVRNQVRKGEKSGLEVVFGGKELIGEFYSVFSTNMRDLGTPVYSPALFQAMRHHLGDAVDFCVVRKDGMPIAASVSIHGAGITEVPSASSLREFNNLNANMLMYWNLLDRAIQRGQRAFDFGRSTIDGPTYRFKKQWGAEPESAVWQFHYRQGTGSDVRPDNPGYGRMIRMWQKLPVRLTRVIGPRIVRGIP